MKIDGIGEHVGYEKPDTVRDYYGDPPTNNYADLYFLDDNERRDIFGDNLLTIDEDAPLTFYSGDDASHIAFDVTIHFLDRDINAFELKNSLFDAGIPDESFIHTWEWKNHIVGMWFEFEGDFNGGFAALDRFIKVCESFKLTYEYKAELHKDAHGNDVPFDDDAIIMYRSPFFTGNGDTMLTIDEVDALIARGLIAPFTGDKVKIKDKDGNIMTYGEYRKIHADIIEF